METIYQLIPREIVEAVGWTLFHSLWQIAVVALGMGIILLIFSKFSASTRYFISFASFVFIIVWVAITFVRSYHYAVEKSELRQAIISNPQMVVDHFKENLKATKTLTTHATEKVNLNIRWLLIKSSIQKYFPALVTIWLLGMLYLILRFVGGLVHVNRMKYRRTKPVDEYWIEKTKIFAEKLKIKRTVGLLQSYLTQIPVTIGYLKPVILLPISAITGLSEKHIESIIAHELAHIVRRDYTFNIIQSIIEILLFYHPAIWWISSVVRNERENSCDDIAVQLTGDSLNYAKALVIMQDQSINQKSYAMAFGIQKNTFLKRIKRLLNQPTMKTNFIEGFIASCIICAGIIGLAFTSNTYPNSGFTNGVSIKPGINGNILTVNNHRVSSAYISKDTLKNTPVQNDTTLQHNNVRKTTAINDADFDVNHLLNEINEKGNISEEVRKEIEVALSDLNNDQTMEILKGIQGALKNMDLNAIVGEAMKGAKAAINNVDVNTIVNEAMKENIKGEKMDADKISKEALKGASAAVEAMDLNKIIAEAMKGVDGALKEVDLSKIINESINEEIQDKHNKSFETDNKYYPIITKGTEEWNKWRVENKNILPNLSAIELKDLNLTEVNLSSMTMKGISIRESDISKADLSRSYLIGAKFKELKADQVNFQNSIANESYFKENTMKQCDFTNANLKNAVFKECDLSGSNFKNADLRGTVFIEGSLENCNFKGAIADGNTKFPEGFNPAQHKIRFE